MTEQTPLRYSKQANAQWLFSNFAATVELHRALRSGNAAVEYRDIGTAHIARGYCDCVEPRRSN